MHADIGVPADRANVLPKHGQLNCCKNEQGTEEGTRVGIVCGSPGVLPCKTVKEIALCHVCRASSAASRVLHFPCRWWKPVLGAGLELKHWSGPAAAGKRANEGKVRACRCTVRAHRKDMQCKQPGKGTGRVAVAAASQCGSLYPDPFSLPPLFGRRGTDLLP